MHYWQEVLKVMGNYWPKSEYLGILFPTTRIEASNSQLPLEPLANSDIPLVVIIDLLLLKNIIKSELNGSKWFKMNSNDHS